jgi:hypothetical protein
MIRIIYFRNTDVCCHQEEAPNKTAKNYKQPSPNKGSSYFIKNLSSVDMKLMSLVGEVTKSKDETIAAKNYAIQLLETMLKNATTGQTPVVVQNE